jgi:endonuclease/exonuclease/phosphatase (EEP) superfamily protein YafD
VPWLWFLVRDLSVVMEVVAIFLPPLVLLGVVALVVAMAVLRQPWLLVAAGSWTLFAVVAVFLPWVPHSTGHVRGGRGVTIAVANVLADNPTKEEAAADVAAIGADVVVVPEDSRRIHDALMRTYAYGHLYRYASSWLGVYSNLPVTESTGTPVFDPARYLRLEVGGPTPFVLWALHPPRPWLTANGSFQMRPGGHARVLSRFLDAIAEETEPVVVAGDLNLTDRGRGYRKFTAHLDDAMRSIRGSRTEIKRLYRPLLLNIDHILEPPDWCADHARRFRIRGSDHRGITARVGPC